MDRIYPLLEKCKLFISLGTSGNVYPAANFIQFVRSSPNVYTLELNMEPSNGATLFDETCYGLATDLVPLVVEELLTCGIPQKITSRI
jgi:NAD-dependent deacetylase